MRFLRVPTERGPRCARSCWTRAGSRRVKIFTGSTFQVSREHLDFLPRCVTLRGLPRTWPVPEGLIHSVASWRLDQITSMYVPRRDYPTDADMTSASGELIFNIFSALAQFERRLIQERTKAGLAAARARGWNGGRTKVGSSEAKVVLAKKLHADKSIEIDDVCKTLRISRSTFYRYVRL